MEAFPVSIPLPVQRPPLTYKGKLKDYKIWTDKRFFIWSCVCHIMSNSYKYKGKLKDYKIWTDKCYWALIWFSVCFFAILIDISSPQLSVSRQSLFEDSFHQIMRLPAYELRRRLYIIFRWDNYLIMVMKIFIYIKIILMTIQGRGGSWLWRCGTWMVLHSFPWGDFISMIFFLEIIWSILSHVS